jgi:hypothetical protein
LIALIFGGAIFWLSFTTGAEPPVEVLAAREDISAGTRISDIPDEFFARMPLTGDPLLVGSYLTEPVWRQIQNVGGVVVKDIYQYEAVPLSSLASDGNPLAVEIPKLGLTDPNLVVVSLTNVNVPSGIQIGDYVDLVVAVESVQQVQSFIVPEPAVNSFLEEPVEEDELEGTALVNLPTPTPTLTPTPTPTPTPAPPKYPLAKVIVKYAKIAAVHRDSNVASTGDSIVLGDITGVDVVIPREAQEFVLMSDTAGQLGLSMLSPLAEEDTGEGPTLGAHFQDLLDLFDQDRKELLEETE